MFHADTAFAVELLALVAGTFLLSSSCKEDAVCRTFGKFVAYFVIILSLLAMLCTFYFTMRYWEDGYFNTSCPMDQRSMHKGMMDGHMMNPDSN